MLWHTADIALTRSSVNEMKRRRLLELAIAASGRESVGAGQMEY